MARPPLRLHLLPVVLLAKALLLLRGLLYLWQQPPLLLALPSQLPLLL